MGRIENRELNRKWDSSEEYILLLRQETGGAPEYWTYSIKSPREALQKVRECQFDWISAELFGMQGDKSRMRKCREYVEAARGQIIEMCCSPARAVSLREEDALLQLPNGKVKLQRTGIEYVLL